MLARSRDSVASLIRAVLTTSWRATPDPLTITAESLDAVAADLIESGAGRLAWHRIRHSPLASAASAARFYAAFRYGVLKAALQEQEIIEAFDLFRSAGVEPVLVKGWAVARAYPQPALRPSSDLDLCVRPADYEAAQRARELYQDKKYRIDLHKGFHTFDREDFDRLFERSQLIKLNDGAIRVLAPEDHFRLVCFHLLRHGAWRPLWLCDVAAMLENRPEDFDWALCLGKTKRQTDWMACVAGLAHQLLGARIEGTPFAPRAKRLPRWLVPAVLRQWDRCRFTAEQIPLDLRMHTSLRRPAKLIEYLRIAWDRPIGATVELRGPFNNLPRFPFQLGSALLHLPKLTAPLLTSFRNR